MSGQQHFTLADYFMGRRELYPLSMSPRIELEAMRTVELVNKLLSQSLMFGVTLEINPRTGSIVSSGWRPPEVNQNTPGAAVKSKHMTGHAVDIYDPDGDLDDWLMSDPGQGALGEIGLWMEHPSATKGWCHLQTLPPRSGRRVFYP